MKPLPYVPDFPLFGVSVGNQVVDHRLDLWNRLPSGDLHYVSLSALHRPELAPRVMVTIQPDRRVGRDNRSEPTELSRLVAVAQIGLLALQDSERSEIWAARTFMGDLVAALLSKLAERSSPWVAATVAVNGKPEHFLRVSWRSGSILVGAVDEVSVLLVVRELNNLDIGLVSVTSEELEEMASRE